MKDTDRFAQMLGISAPWRVTVVELDKEELTLSIVVRHDDSDVCCPRCSKAAEVYDYRKRCLRHLDSMEYRTLLEVFVPRTKCAEHGVLMIDVPWADTGSRFTQAFESLMLAWLLEASVSAVAEQFGIGHSTVRRIMKRAVARGLERRGPAVGAHISVDEVSFRRGHRYMTIISDQTSGHVLCVRDGRTIDSLGGYFTALTPEQRQSIRTISMDMHGAYIKAVELHFENAQQLICFDHFHVAQYLGRSVDRVRAEEQRELRREQDTRLDHTRYMWLYRPENLPDKYRERFEALRESTLKTAEAWSLREMASHLWQGSSAEDIRGQWELWIAHAMTSTLEPVIAAAKQIRNGLYGIVNAILHGRSNARAESLNGRIKRVKARAYGFRTADNYIAAIMFHLGGLDLSHVEKPAST